MSYEVTGDDGNAIDGARISSLCGRDWGLWRTSTENLARIGAALDALDAPPAWLADAKRRLGTLSEQLDTEPKSTNWRVAWAIACGGVRSRMRSRGSVVSSGAIRSQIPVRILLIG
jgi:hypothetical protein